MGTSVTKATESPQENAAANQTVADSTSESKSTNNANRPQPDTYFSLDCSEDAVKITRNHSYLFDRNQITKLCRSARSSAPALCAEKAAKVTRSHSYFYAPDQIVNLCQNAESIEPALCGEKASKVTRNHSYFYSADDTIELCKPEVKKPDCE